MEYGDGRNSNGHFSFTSPIIIITMISEVNPIYYQASRLIEYGLGGIINIWINKID